MGGQVAVAVLPLDNRFRTGGAIPAGFYLGCPVASFAGLDYLLTMPAVVAAAFGAHESAFTTFTNGLTNHGINTPLSNYYTKNGQNNCPHLAICNL